FISNEFTGNTPLKSLNIILPMGISFYTFKSISYLVDVYRRKYRAERNFFKFALYISFFPQLIQGPISRFDAMSKSLFTRHNYNHKNFIRGFYRLLWGYFKKMVVADRIMPAVLTIISDSETYNGAFAFLGIMFYAIQIYADFSGGIDITIAIAEMLGIKVEENFIRPYFSKNIKEYWRRWHITMGVWFRDYVFYSVSVSNPMLKLSKFSRKHFGKNIGKRVPVYISALTVWFLTGLWHGAGWNFVVWGLLNGICILISDELKGLYAVFHKFIPVKKLPFRLYDVFSAMRTVFIMSSIRMLDCYQDVGTAFKAFFSIFRVNNWDRVLVTDLGINAADYAVIGIGAVVIFLTSLASRKIDIRDRILGKNEVLWYPLLALLFIIILIFGVYGIGYDSSQFIYNRF
ncbi:MAG: MBOAT family O-acyltransferase, partial [Catonella sp.]